MVLVVDVDSNSSNNHDDNDTDADSADFVSTDTVHGSNGFFSLYCMTNCMH